MYRDDMVTGTLTTSEIREDLSRALKPYEITVDEFLAADLESYSDANLRDMWIMVKGILKPAK